MVAIDARWDAARDARGVHPRRAHPDRAWTRWSGPGGPRRSGPARSCSRRWTATAPRSGFDLELTAAISDAVGIPVIASGGVGTLDHLVEGVTEGRADAVLAASIFHFGEFTIAEAKAHLAAAGVAVRPV